jgi:hypothetical protein
MRSTPLPGSREQATTGGQMDWQNYSMGSGLSLADMLLATDAMDRAASDINWDNLRRRMRDGNTEG